MKKIKSQIIARQENLINLNYQLNNYQVIGLAKDDLEMIKEAIVIEEQRIENLSEKLSQISQYSLADDFDLIEDANNIIDQLGSPSSEVKAFDDVDEIEVEENYARKGIKTYKRRKSGMFFGYSNLNLKKRKKLSKKLARLRRRRFVDRVVMNHVRAHEKSREMVRDFLKKKGKVNLITKQKKQKNTLSLQKEKSKEKWSDKVDPRHKIQQLRGRVELNRVRARTRWLSVQQ